MAPWLRKYMESQSVTCFSSDCRRRHSYPWGILALARFLRKERIDILHTHLFEPSVIGLSAGVLAGTPIRVMTRHYSDYHTRINKRLHVCADKYCNRLSHAVIAVSQHTAEHLVSEEGTPPAKVHTVLNGIGFERVKLSSPDAPSRLRNEFAADGAPLLLMVGRLHPEKGYQFLFEAMAKLKNSLDKPIRLLVAGTGPLLDSYRQQVESLSCTDTVHFLGFRKDVADLMAAADLVVLPSVAEAFGTSVTTEAIYLGTPVVATRVGGIPEIVNDGIDGVLVPPANSQALADAIANLLRDPERRRRLAGAGRQKIQDRFQFADMVRSYEQIYQALANSKPDGAAKQNRLTERATTVNP